MLMGEFKQNLLRINNKVNMEIFGQGLLQQRVDVIHNRAVIVARNRRVSVLSVAYDADKNTVENVDRILIDKFKERFIRLVERELGLKVLTHLKDYDPVLELSASVSFFEKPIEELLPGVRAGKS